MSKVSARAHALRVLPFVVGLENRNLIYIHPHIYLCGIKVYSEGGPASLWWYIELYFAVSAEGLPSIFVAHLAHTFIWDFLVFETQSKKNTLYLVNVELFMIDSQLGPFFQHSTL